MDQHKPVSYYFDSVAVIFLSLRMNICLSLGRNYREWLRFPCYSRHSYYNCCRRSFRYTRLSNLGHHRSYYFCTSSYNNSKSSLLDRSKVMLRIRMFGPQDSMRYIRSLNRHFDRMKRRDCMRCNSFDCKENNRFTDKIGKGSFTLRNNLSNLRIHYNNLDCTPNFHTHNRYSVHRKHYN